MFLLRSAKSNKNKKRVHGGLLLPTMKKTRRNRLQHLECLDVVKHFYEIFYLNRLISISIRDRVYCGDLLSHIVTVAFDCFITDVQFIVANDGFFRYRYDNVQLPYSLVIDNNVGLEGNDHCNRGYQFSSLNR